MISKRFSLFVSIFPLLFITLFSSNVDAANGAKCAVVVTGDEQNESLQVINEAKSRLLRAAKNETKLLEFTDDFSEQFLQSLKLLADASLSEEQHAKERRRIGEILRVLLEVYPQLSIEDVAYSRLGPLNNSEVKNLKNALEVVWNPDRLAAMGIFGLLGLGTVMGWSHMEHWSSLNTFSKVAGTALSLPMILLSHHLAKLEFGGWSQAFLGLWKSDKKNAQLREKAARALFTAIVDKLRKNPTLFSHKGSLPHFSNSLELLGWTATVITSLSPRPEN